MCLCYYSQGDECMDLNQFNSEISKLVSADYIRYNEPMKNHTTFKVGGPADLFIEPGTANELAALIQFLSQKQVPYMILGNGSNLIVRDGGIRGCVISLVRLDEIVVDEEQCMLQAGCGAKLSAASAAALRYSLKGMEFASGIPGTIGGAVTMNAGAYGPEIKDVLDFAEVMDMDGNVFRLTNDEMLFTYRHSIVQTKGYIVLKAGFKLEAGSHEVIRSRMNELNGRRSDKQPLEFPSAGSTFKRPDGHFAAKLIEDCGLKGLQLGGAMVSEKHSGFIINYDNANAKDIIGLIGQVRQIVQQRYGITLETEVKIIGEE